MSFFQLAEQYFALVRRISRLHKLVLDKYDDEINHYVSEIDIKMSEYGSRKDLNSKDLLNFRILIFKLQDLLDLSIVDEYNKLLDTMKIPDIALDTTKQELDMIEENIVPNNNIWKELKEYLKENMNESAFNVWVEPTNLLELNTETNEIKVKVDNFFYKRFLEENCSPLLRKYIDDHRLDYDIKFIA